MIGIESRLINLGSTSGEALPDRSVSSSNGLSQGLNRDSKSEPAIPPLVVSASAMTAAQPSGPQLQLNIDTLLARRSDRQELLRDVEATLRAIDRRREDFRTEYQSSMEELAQRVRGHEANLLGSGYTQPAGDELAEGIVAQLTAEIQSLQAELRGQTFQRDVLLQNVDQARTTRTTLETKAQEASIGAAAAGGKAIIAASATVPTAPSSPPPLSRTLPPAALLGLLIGLALALVRGREDAQPTVKPPADRALADTREAAGIGR